MNAETQKGKNRNPTPTPTNNAKQNEQKQQQIQLWVNNKQQKDKNDQQLLDKIEENQKAIQERLSNDPLQLQKLFERGNELISKNEIEEGLEQLKKAAEGDHSKALYELGKIYEVYIYFFSQIFLYYFLI